MIARHCKVGEVLVEQGVIAPALFIVSAGVLSALRKGMSGEIEVLRLAPGDCFGQASMLTGDASRFKVKAVTRAVVYEIARADLAPILEARPAIALELGRILARRNAADEARIEALAGADIPDERLASRLADRVKSFFGLG